MFKYLHRVTGKLVHDDGVLGLVKCPGDMLNKETQYLLILLSRHKVIVICQGPRAAKL